MPIDLGKALGAELRRSEFSWDADRVILYHLGVGAGNPPTDPGELEYAYEADLKVLPSFATIPPFGSMLDLASIEGLDVNLAMLLHGEHELALSKTIPTGAAVESHGTVAEIYDKGKAALAILEMTTRDARGEELFVNRASLFLRGEGGFGGDPGPSPGHEPPGRDPDLVVESATLPQQALLYRLASGDKNPLHADPGFAALGGFDRPILHGLCSYGIVCKAAVDRALGGDVAAVARYRARFRGVVYPGETIVTRIWDEGDRLVLEAGTRERGEPVISNAAIWRREP